TFSENINSKVQCPFRIGIAPDTLNLLMQDSVWRDSLVRSGFKNLKQIVSDVFGYDEVLEPEGGEAGAEVEASEEKTDVNLPKDDNKLIQPPKSDKPNPNSEKETLKTPSKLLDDKKDKKPKR
ncbi:MAG: hypothetical protein R2774_08905, partial [Saprospiraceae bacterium]